MATQVAEARMFREEMFAKKAAADLRCNETIVLHRNQEDEVRFRVIAVVPLPRPQDPHMEQEFEIHCITADGRGRKLLRSAMSIVEVVQR